MIVIGLTGGIGMGKSTAAMLLRRMKLPVHDADKAVHDLLRKGGKAVKPVAKLFPAALKRNAIDRKIIGKAIFDQPAKLRQLERILHPLVRQSEQVFLQAVRKRGTACAVLDIPLLFETGADRRCDVTICVTAGLKLQKQRVMERRGMTPAKFKAIVKRQLPDSEKRRRADFVVRSDRGVEEMGRELQKIIKAVCGR